MNWSDRSGLRTMSAAARAAASSILALGLLGAKVAPPQDEPEAREGQLSPRFFLPELDGGEFVLRCYAGPDSQIYRACRARRREVVVLSFFATWCVSCREELPELQRLSRAYAGQPIQWRLVNVADTPDSTLAFVRKLGVSIPVLLDRYAKVQKEYTDALPTLVVIDRAGVVRYLYKGYDRYSVHRAAAAISAALVVPVPAGWEVPETGR